MVVVVSNQGKVHYLEKDLGYDFPKARALYNECVAEISKKSYGVLLCWNDVFDKV